MLHSKAIAPDATSLPMQRAAPRLLTFADLAKTYRIPRSSAYVLLSKGLIAARKIGSRTLVEAESVESYVAACPRFGGPPTAKAKN